MSTKHLLLCCLIAFLVAQCSTPEATPPSLPSLATEEAGPPATEPVVTTSIKDTPATKPLLSTGIKPMQRLDDQQLIALFQDYYPAMDPDYRYCEEEEEITYQVSVGLHRYYRLGNTLRMLVVLNRSISETLLCPEGSGPAHVDCGYGDLFVLEQQKEDWVIVQHVAKAISGNGWGQPANIHGTLVTGDRRLSIWADQGYSSGGVFVGHYCLLHINPDLTVSTTHFLSHHDNFAAVDDEANASCACVYFKFEEAPHTPHYYLHLEKYDCSGMEQDCTQGTLLESAIVPYKEDRYPIPASFLE